MKGISADSTCLNSWANLLNLRVYGPFSCVYSSWITLCNLSILCNLSFFLQEEEEEETLFVNGMHNNIA